MYYCYYISQEEIFRISKEVKVARYESWRYSLDGFATSYNLADYWLRFELVPTFYMWTFCRLVPIAEIGLWPLCWVDPLLEVLVVGKCKAPTNRNSFPKEGEVFWIMSLLIKLDLVARIY